MFNFHFILTRFLGFFSSHENIDLAVLDLRKSYAQTEGYKPEEIRVFYRPSTGGDLGVEDDEFLNVINPDNAGGKFMAEFPHVGVFSGKVTIELEDPSQKVEVLLGSPKSFEHFLLKGGGEKNILKLDFAWVDNKIAIVDKEEEYVKYDATQYLIKDKWTVVICKNPNAGKEGDPKWIMKRKVVDDDDYFINGAKKEYFAKHESMKSMKKIENNLEK